MPIHGWVLLLAFTAGGWIGGLLYRAGYLRYMTRDAAVGMIPGAGGCTSAVFMVLLANSPAKWFFFALFVAFGAWMVVVWFRPPDFLKPRWLREEEQQTSAADHRRLALRKLSERGRILASRPEIGRKTTRNLGGLFPRVQLLERHGTRTRLRM